MDVEVSEGHAQGAELRRACGRRSWQARWIALGSGGTRATPDAAHPASSRTLERRPGARASTVGDSSSSATRPTSSRAALRASGRGRARVQPGPDLIHQQPARHRVSLQSRPAGGDPRPTDARALRTYRGRSTCASILPQFRQQLVQRCDGWGCRRRADEVRTGGVSQPFRTDRPAPHRPATDSSSRAGDRARPLSGPRSVIRTVSPDAATRTYSLSCCSGSLYRPIAWDVG